MNNENNRYCLKDRELVYTPLFEEEIEERMNRCEDEDKKQKYADILEGAKKDPDKAIWYTVWNISQRKGDMMDVGEVWFNGAPERGTVDIELEIGKRFRNNQYGTSTLRSMVKWAFAQKGIYVITATVGHENDTAIDILSKVGFVYRDGSRKMDNYAIVKPRTIWLGLYLFIGVCAGMLIGIMLDNMILGVAIGIVIGAAIGGIMDMGINKTRKEIMGDEKGRKRRK